MPPSPPRPEGSAKQNTREHHSIDSNTIDRMHTPPHRPAHCPQPQGDTTHHPGTHAPTPHWGTPPHPVPHPPPGTDPHTTPNHPDNPHPTRGTPHPPQGGQEGGGRTPPPTPRGRGDTPWHTRTETREHQQANGNEHAKPQRLNSTIHANTPTAANAPAPSNSTTRCPTKKAAVTTSRTSNGSANATTQ